MEKETVVLRPRRQITLPREVCKALGIKPGDKLVLEIADGVLTARSRKARALEALEALRKAIAESGVTEEEMLEGAREVRDQLFKEKYGHLLERRTKNRRRRSA